MKTRKLTSISILLGVGLILHFITPGFLGNMKPDFLLVMFFISIGLCSSISEVLGVSIACGILSALTTTIPGGEIANIVDKLGTGIILYYLLKRFKKYPYIAIFVGTLLSGSIFLYALQIMRLLPLSFISMFITLVLPTAFINSLLYIFIMHIIKRNSKFISI